MKNLYGKLFGIGAAVLMLLLVVTPAIAIVPRQWQDGSFDQGPRPTLKQKIDVFADDDDDQPDITQQMQTILGQHASFLIPMNAELQTYADQHGDLDGFEFTPTELSTLSTIYSQLEALIIDDHQDPPGDWQGYIGYADPQHLLNPDRYIYMFWIPHYLIPAFCVAIDSTNLACALWLGAIIGAGLFDSIAMKILYGLSTFIRNGYTGYTVSLIEQRYNQDPSDDDGVKVTFINLVTPFRFLPEFVYIDAQEYSDVPPHSHGSIIFPDPI
jgi:hypothetical protein